MTQPVRFLLVDDLDENLTALAALLARDGLEILTARSGAEALELLLVHDVSLALLDVQMPGMSGFELAELMRGTARTRLVPIIFITAAGADEERRFKGYEAGAVDFVLKPVDPFILRSKTAVFYELGRQRQELRAAERRANAALQRLHAHTDNSPLGIVECDADLRVLAWSQGAERIFGRTAAETLGRDLRACGVLAPESGRALGERFAALLADPARDRGLETAAALHADGRTLDCEWYCSVLRDAAGRPESLTAQVLDVTERRRAEETQRLLVDELNHRVKNTLANVQAIATQTLRGGGDLDSFGITFLGRLQSMARAHAILSEATWQGASIDELVRDQTQLGTVDPSRREISGPDLLLPPATALRLALIIHELSTNANKYGAFANDTGRLRLSWETRAGGLALRWEENGGPAVTAPQRTGFGTTLIEQSAQAENGSAAARWRPEGVVWEVVLPLDGAAAQPAASAPEPEPATPAAEPRPTAGARFLVVEDEPLIGMEMIAILEDQGATVTGPVPSVAQALAAIEAQPFDAAFLDGNLRGEPVDAVAAALCARGVPFAFVSGYGRRSLPAAFATAEVVGKPFSSAQILAAAADLLGRSADLRRA